MLDQATGKVAKNDLIDTSDLLQGMIGGDLNADIPLDQVTNFINT
tara:strand:+ start:262 stop:396 length:135 start_codon:yes stop_codon:yes gene_type:complete